MKKPKFDSEQKKTGHNKFGHYQFGKYSCQFCKSDRLEKVEFLNGEKVKNCFECLDCSGKSIIN